VNRRVNLASLNKLCLVVYFPQSHTAHACATPHTFVKQPAHLCGTVFVCPPLTFLPHRANPLCVRDNRGRMAVDVSVYVSERVWVWMWMWVWVWMRTWLTKHVSVVVRGLPSTSRYSSWGSCYTCRSRATRLRFTTPVCLAAFLRAVGVCAQSRIAHTRLRSVALVRASSPQPCSILLDKAPRVSAGTTLGNQAPSTFM
jgi:hypothetical protein